MQSSLSKLFLLLTAERFYPEAAHVQRRVTFLASTFLILGWSFESGGYCDRSLILDLLIVSILFLVKTEGFD